MIELDGSQGEGGGQILRTALSLSLISLQPFRIFNIRAKRPKPGLMRQHLACVQAAQAIASRDGEASASAQDDAGQNVQIGSTSLQFSPAPVRGGRYEFAIGSAGSSMLVLQTVLWPLLLSKEGCELTSELILRGGTHNPMAPCFDYLQMLSGMIRDQQTNEACWSMELIRHGFYPAGGGQVQVKISPPASGWKAIDLVERGKLIEARAECLHAGIPRGVAERELAALEKALGWETSSFHNRPLRANEGPGNALLAHLRYENVSELFTSYGDKGVSAEQVAQNLLREIHDYQKSDAPVGSHMADQLLLPAALAATRGQNSQFRCTTITPHTKTNAQVIERFLKVKCAIDETARSVKVLAS